MENTKSINAKRKGITLIALVITIIVLLILAGITINLTIGQDGILRRAEEAGKNYTNAAEYERNQLAEFLNETDNIIANVTGGGNGNNPPKIPEFGTTIRTENNVNYIADGKGNEIPVPVGFKALEGAKDIGFVIQDVTTNADGTPTDTNGNEFVWVPCTLDGANGSITYARYAFTGDSLTQTLDTTTGEIKQGTSTVYTETMPSDEESSIRTYGGYYIGRYESGVAGYDASVNKTPDGSEEWTGYSNGKLVIKQNQQVWNNITRDMAKNVAEGLYKKSNGASVNSKLCSSYAWDTALKFIETKYPTYPTNSTQGNYKDKSETLGMPAKTGLTVAVNNIYDMGGNAWEWTTEGSSDASAPCTIRGGAWDRSSIDGPAALRMSFGATNANSYVGFRSTLYL